MGDATEAIRALRAFLADGRFATAGALVTDLDGTAVLEHEGRIVLPPSIERGLQHVHRRGRPVVAPYSFPSARTSSCSAPSNSVGSGPFPTRVVYALTTPSTPSIAVGAIPVPTAAPPEVVLLDVTYG